MEDAISASARTYVQHRAESCKIWLVPTWRRGYGLQATIPGDDSWDEVCLVSLLTGSPTDGQAVCHYIPHYVCNTLPPTPGLKVNVRVRKTSSDLLSRRFQLSD